MLISPLSLVIVAQGALILTGSTVPRTAPDNRVFTGVLVALRTVRDRGLSGPVADPCGGFTVRYKRGAGAVSPSEIFALSDRLKMPWVDAAPDPALVIQNFAVRDWADQQFVRDFMRDAGREGSTRTRDAHQRVAVFGDRFDPQPAASVWLWRYGLLDSFDKITEGHSILLEIGRLGLRGATNAVCGPFSILSCHNTSISAD